MIYKNVIHSKHVVLYAVVIDNKWHMNVKKLNLHFFFISLPSLTFSKLVIKSCDKIELCITLHNTKRLIKLILTKISRTVRIRRNSPQ